MPTLTILLLVWNVVLLLVVIGLLADRAARRRRPLPDLPVQPSPDQTAVAKALVGAYLQKVGPDPERLRQHMTTLRTQRALRRARRALR